MSKIVSMPSNPVYRENWDRIFGKPAPEPSEKKASGLKPEKTACCTGCDCVKEKKGKKA